MISTVERILILAKTYPSPSTQHVETSCVAGINEQGMIRRLFPVPFRLIEEDRQFKKWQWINARIEKAGKDHRPESHRIYVDTIECGEKIGTKGHWRGRRTWIDKIPSFTSFTAMEEKRKDSGATLALLRPKKILGLEVAKARNPEWTEEEREKLLREQLQGDLFSEAESRREIRELRKVPFDFYYRYLCETPAGDIEEHRHKVTDWEAGMLYWNCQKDHGPNWEEPFRAKLEKEFLARDLMFIMGTVHRFPDQWLIISLIYPPKPTPGLPVQEALPF
jgi:hypothetical protein